MSRCLDEQQFVSLYYGDATDEQALHVKSCISCRRDYQRLEQDLALVGEALAEPVPIREALAEPVPIREALAEPVPITEALIEPQPIVETSAYVAPHWSWLAATAAVIALLAVNVARVSDRTDPIIVAESGQQVLSAALEEVGSAIFDSNAYMDNSTRTETVEFAYLQAALDGDLPCSWQEPFYSSGCEYSLMGFSEFSQLSMGG